MRPRYLDGPPEIIVVKRTSRRHALPHALWWQPGVYGSGPAVLLWIIARLPAETLSSVFSTPAAAALFNHAGDTVFVTGWVASAAWLWFTRKRPDRPAHPGHEPSPPRGAVRDDATVTHRH